ncbi:MipA/OmpV family protein [Pelagicoccus sp. SDUM812005]|uniref:MipA/OmpV family protein n=1 Tax=Pelagicoccus sp. SDUM812005 TaxID=3041257 RepID=UPI00281095F6|nr:MipA/OmpV family protein [Pelagicoccus sp. SDUM812005]MDQ8180398.1 MipA/OmpV family protein [Pelagicoccus sp. SDUM812005]
MKFGVSALICTNLSLVLASLANGQHRAEEGDGDWDVMIGVGAIVEPISPGLDETETDPMPFLDITYKDRFFVNRHGIGGYLFRGPQDEHGEGFSLGLALGRADGRDEKDYAAHLKGMGDIDEGFEANFFMEGELGPAEYTWTVSKGLKSEGHDGLHSELGFSFGGALTDNFLLEYGPFIHYADSNYMQSFYGVTANQAALSKFSEYKPSSGIDLAGFKVIAKTRLTGNWMLMGMVEYNSLLGDAKDSPIVEDDSFVSYGLGVGFQF